MGYLDKIHAKEARDGEEWNEVNGIKKEHWDEWIRWKNHAEREDEEKGNGQKEKTTITNASRRKAWKRAMILWIQEKEKGEKLLKFNKFYDRLRERRWEEEDDDDEERLSNEFILTILMEVYVKNYRWRRQLMGIFRMEGWGRAVRMKMVDTILHEHVYREKKEWILYDEEELGYLPKGEEILKSLSILEMLLQWMEWDMGIAVIETHLMDLLLYWILILNERIFCVVEVAKKEGNLTLVSDINVECQLIAKWMICVIKQLNQGVKKSLNWHGKFIPKFDVTKVIHRAGNKVGWTPPMEMEIHMESYGKILKDLFLSTMDTMCRKESQTFVKETLIMGCMATSAWYNACHRNGMDYADVLGHSMNLAWTNHRNDDQIIFSQLAMARGALTCCDESILLDCWPFDDASPNENHSLIGNIIMPIILKCCLIKESKDSAGRFVTFQTLVLYLQTLRDLYKKFSLSTKVQSHWHEEIGQLVEKKHLETIIEIIWDNWDDPVEGINNQMRHAFSVIIEIYEIAGNGSTEESLLILAEKLLQMDWHRRHKYGSLALLLKKLNAIHLLNLCPDLITLLLHGLRNIVITPHASELLIALILKLDEEKISSDLWMRPIIKAMMAEEDALLQRNIGMYLLRPIMKSLPKTCNSLLRALHEKKTSKSSESVMKATIVVLKLGRILGILDFETVIASQPDISIILEQCLCHENNLLQSDALSFFIESNKTSSRVSLAELSLYRKFISANMHNPSTDFRSKLFALSQKFFVRMRDHIKLLSRERRSWETMDQFKPIYSEFFNWLINFLTNSLNPDISFQRVTTSLHLLLLIFDCFSFQNYGYFISIDKPIYAFDIYQKNTLSKLSRALNDSLFNLFEKNRRMAFDLLTKIPAETLADVLGMLLPNAAHDIICYVDSPRAGESEGASLALTLFFVKIAKELNQPISLFKVDQFSDITCFQVLFIEQLIAKLESHLDVVEKDMLVAACDAPLHGILKTLQFISGEIVFRSTPEALSIWKKILERILFCSQRISNIVLALLCHPSPEGLMTLDTCKEMEVAINNISLENREDDVCDEDSPDFVGPKTQLILSYCWRALKECSFMVQSFVVSAWKQRLAGIMNGLLLPKQVTDIGLWYIKLLLSVRHWGAIASVHECLLDLSKILLQHDDPNLRKLPLIWLKEILDLIGNSKTNIATSRRSAGLPFAILALTIAELPLMSSTLTDLTMEKLFELANEPVSTNHDVKFHLDLTQVHSMNILRALFKDTHLGNHIMAHIPPALSLALDGFSSSIWAIRNASTMLFTVLLHRVFGSKKTKDEDSVLNSLTVRELFSRFPELYNILLTRLEKAVTDIRINSPGAPHELHPSLFPLLCFFARLQPSLIEGRTAGYSTKCFIPLLLRCLDNPIYKIREMCAKAIAPLLTSDECLDHVINCCRDLRDSVHGHNFMHGLILQIKFALDTHLYSPGNYDIRQNFINLATIIVDSFRPFITNFQCGTIKLLILQIMQQYFVDCDWIEAELDDRKRADTYLAVHSEFMYIKTDLLDLCIKSLNAASVDCLPFAISSSLTKGLLAKIYIALLRQQPKLLDSSLIENLIIDEYEVAINLIVEFQLLLKEQPIIPCMNEYSIARKLIQIICNPQKLPELQVAAFKSIRFLQPDLLRNLKNEEIIHLFQATSKIANGQSCTALSVQCAAIVFYGSLVGTFVQENCRETCSTYVKVWIQILIRYSQEVIPFPYRLAVAKSLKQGLNTILKVYRDDILTLLSICSLILILVQDDDEDIRRIMCHIISLLSQNHMVIQNPQRSLEILLEEFTLLPQLCSEIFQFLTSRIEPCESLEQLFIRESIASKKLFFEERPNAFRDDLTEIQACFRILLQNYIHWKKDDLLHHQNRYLQDWRHLINILSSEEARKLDLTISKMTRHRSFFLHIYRLTLISIVFFPMTSHEAPQELSRCMTSCLKYPIHDMLLDLIQSCCILFEDGSNMSILQSHLFCLTSVTLQ